ncbi:MAG TPA: hypothetical protein VLL04_07055, partial [Rhizomicrobium sp.]|nr:hypothetical protein [Rhizomicrobium sp.]
MGSFKTYWLTGGLVCAFLPVLAASTGHAVNPKTGQGDAASCAALAGQSVAADTVIESAQYLPQGGVVG